MTGIDLSVKDGQSGADLRKIDLSSADLSEADLSDADLAGANLYATILIQANLSRAYLVGANFNSTRLHKANFSGADLSRAAIRWSYRSEVYSITQKQLDSACGDSNTILPRDMTIPMCSEVEWFEAVQDMR